VKGGLLPELISADAHDAEEANSARHLGARRELARINAEAALRTRATAGAEAFSATLVIVSDTNFAFILDVATEHLLA
jgi:hypothetical protein